MTCAYTFAELGDLSGIVHNLPTDEIIGGNQRSRVFDINECEIVLEHKAEKPDGQGTVGFGYVIWKNHRYSYRQVVWDAKTCERASLASNVHLGFVYIYALVRVSNKAIFYIGKSKNISKRGGQHRSKATRGYKSRLYNYIRYLWKQNDDFAIVKLKEVPDAFWPIFEIKAIEFFRRIGCNLRNTTAGGKNPRHVLHSRKKLSVAMSGRKLTAEHRAKISAANKGKAPWNKGVATGLPSPMSNPEVRAKVSAKLKGRVITPEWRRKISEAKMGQSPANKGRQGLQGKPVYQLDTETGEILNWFRNARLALRFVGGASSGSISECLHGKRGTAYGYKWRFAEMCTIETQEAV